ncbi:MAG: 2Fe-2S iron-sulfur cluster-binding protein [Bradyrhizobium sp.]
MRVTLVRPGDPAGAPSGQDYDIPDEGLASISSALQYLARHVDGGIGFYLSCRRGMCACCVVKANGKIETACITAVSEGMVIEPIRPNLLVKDTVVDLSMAKDYQFSFGEEAR